MKHNLCLILLSSTMLVSCIKETKTVTKESNPYGDVAECVRTNTCVDGSTTGGWNPGGSTTGGASSGVIPDDPDWGKIYPDGVPTGTCSTPTGTGYDTRKAVLTSSGKYDYYDPENSVTQNYKSTDEQLKTLGGAISLFNTDALVKIRFKALPEPESSGTDQRVCYGRFAGSPGLGYTQMKIWGSIIGIRADDSKGYHPLHPSGIEMAVNSCTPALDLSPYKAMYPKGIYLQINQVKVNEGEGTPYSTYGVPHTKCWSIQFEIATDGTKTFN